MNHGENIGDVAEVLQDAFSKAAAHGKPPKHFLFFSQSADGQAAAHDFHQHLQERAKERDTPVTNETIQAQW